MLGGFLLRGALRKVKRRTDYAEYGGAPLVGVNGVCIICHGKSNSKAICNAVRVAADFVQKDTNLRIQEELQKHHPASVSAAGTPNVHLTV
jgi:glycerol-3-phosphate acyltransferase PlsX